MVELTSGRATGRPHHLADIGAEELSGAVEDFARAAGVGSTAAEADLMSAVAVDSTAVGAAGAGDGVKAQPWPRYMIQPTANRATTKYAKQRTP